MAQYFLDTSAAVKYYHAEVGTPVVSAMFAEANRGVRISSLGLVEIQSAFAMKVRTGALDRQAAGIQRARLMLDIAAGDIEVFRVTEDTSSRQSDSLDATASVGGCELSTRYNWRLPLIYRGKGWRITLSPPIGHWSTRQRRKD